MANESPEIAAVEEEEPLADEIRVEETNGEGELDLKQTITERLREQRKTNAEQITIDLDLPNYNGNLFCRYRLLDGPELDEVTNKVKAQFRDRSDRILAATCYNLITGCEEFFVRHNREDIPLREVLGLDRPVRYDMVLAEFLGFAEELPTPHKARDVLMGVFVNRDVAINYHGAQYFRWMMSSGAEVDMELGEL